MWVKLDDWQLRQIERLAKLDPARAESLLNTLWRLYPGLFEEIAIGAVEQGSLSAQDAAELLACDVISVNAKVIGFRHFTQVQGESIVFDEQYRCAKLRDSGIAVWEIVREMRKHDSLETLRSAYPSLTEGEISAALFYAERHPDEIGQQIEHFEERIRRRLSESLY